MTHALDDDADVAMSAAAPGASAGAAGPVAILPLRETVLFPGAVVPLAAGRPHRRASVRGSGLTSEARNGQGLVPATKHVAFRLIGRER